MRMPRKPIQWPFARDDQAADHYWKDHRKRYLATWPNFGAGLLRRVEY